MRRQGPHQEAQTSTSTGVVAASTSASKVASLRTTTEGASATAWDCVDSDSRKPAQEREPRPDRWLIDADIGGPGDCFKASRLQESRLEESRLEDSRLEDSRLEDSP